MKTANLNASLDKYISLTWILVLPFMLFFSLLYRIVEATVYAVFGKIFAAVLNIPISYTHVLKLTVVALTPVIVFGMLLDLFHLRIQHLWMICFVIAMAYIIYAIQATKE